MSACLRDGTSPINRLRSQSTRPPQPPSALFARHFHRCRVAAGCSRPLAFFSHRFHPRPDCFIAQPRVDSHPGHLAVSHLLHDHSRKSICLRAAFAHKLKRLTKRLAARLALELSSIQIQPHYAVAVAQISHSMPMILMQLQTPLLTSSTYCTCARCFDIHNEAFVSIVIVFHFLSTQVKQLGQARLHQLVICISDDISLTHSIDPIKTRHFKILLLQRSMPALKSLIHALDNHLTAIV